jgi:glycine/D-amino acid oxidase-like deaminating enzyme
VLVTSHRCPDGQATGAAMLDIRALIALSEGASKSAWLADELIYAPHLGDASNELFADALVDSQANVVIHQRGLDRATLGSWRAAHRSGPLVSVRIGRESHPVASLARPDEWARLEGVCEGVHLLAVPMSEGALARALGAAERTRQHAVSPRVGPAQSIGGRAPSVMVIGMGVVNLVTAYKLATAGFEVYALDARPDPRLGRSWRSYGCSRGGANARMFTLTEADDYHDRAFGRQPVNSQFRRSVSQRGWMLCDPGVAEEEWIRDFERVPAWLARAYNADTLALNRASGSLWDEWIRTEPQLFEDIELQDDILRIYSDAAQFGASLCRQNSVGATKRVYSTADVRAAHPALGNAAPGVIAGGILVKGFTLQVHNFMAKLLDGLETTGANLRFDARVSELIRDGGEVTGAHVGERIVRCDHYVLSPGTEFSSLSLPPTLRNRVHGVLGCWATVPNIEPRLTNSLKLARLGHLAEDTNVTVARDGRGDPVLVFGSGYGYVGSHGKVNRRELEVLFTALLDTIRVYFPQSLEAVGAGRAQKSFRYCVRPWTASNLGIFEMEPTPQGVAVWTGGHNTGGFAQAPVVAEAVHAALRGEPHAMHVAYAARRSAGIGSLI